jgi:hypothetical protein
MFRKRNPHLFSNTTIKMDTTDFREKIAFPQLNPAARVYIHGSTYAENAFLHNPDPIIRLTPIITYVKETLAAHRNIVSGYDFLFGAVWGDKQRKMLDIIGFCGLNPKDWPGNPDLPGKLFRNGTLVSALELERAEMGATCGDGVIVLAEEEKHRRRSDDLQDYVAKPALPGEPWSIYGFADERLELLARNG